MKRSISFILIIATLLSSGFATADTQKPTIVVWSYTNELQTIIEQYYKPNHPDVDFRFEMHVTDGNEYTTALDKSFKKDPASSEMPDIFALESTFIDKYIESDSTADLRELGFSEDDYANTYAAVLEAGRNKKGIQKALSWQSTFTVLIYRASLAEKYLDVHSPKQFQEMVQDYSAFLSTARMLNKASSRTCKILVCPDDILATDNPWSPQNKDNSKVNLKGLYKNLKSEKLTHNKARWSETWFAGMCGETDTLAYIFPAWGIYYTLIPHCVSDWDFINPESDKNIKNAKENGTYGDWRAVPGPFKTLWGGTWIAANQKKLVHTDKEKKDAIKELIQFLTLNEDFLYQYCLDSGDFVSNRAVIRKIIENDHAGLGFLGGQELFTVIDEAATNTHIK